MKHLIKRKNLEYTIKEGWRCEVRTESKPSGSNAKPNDEIYIAQNGYAIFAKGIIAEVNILELNGLEEFVRFSQHGTNVKDDSFWISKIKNYSSKKVLNKVFVFEYNISNIEQFDYCIPLEKRFLIQSSWYYLEDEFQFTIPENSNELTNHIPTKIREEVYHIFKINSKEHILDIDHFVPRSLGGPGNIIENLIPISASINRRKGNSVPSKLYDLAKKFGIKTPANFEFKHDKFYSKPLELTLAKRIIEQINAQSITEVKTDYEEIRKAHFPYL